MKKQLKKGFLALALIFTLIGTQTLKNNKIGAYAPTQPIEEFKTPNLLIDYEVVSYQDSIPGPYTNIIGLKIDSPNQIFKGYILNLLNYYILDLNGLQQYIDQITLVSITNGNIDGGYLNLNIDKLSQLQIISAAELIGVYEIQNDNLEVIMMFNTPEQLGEINAEMIKELGVGLYNYNAELLYEQPIDKNGLNAIFDLINRPIDDLLNYIGIDNSIVLTPGFGSITWFEITLRQAIKLAIGLLIGLWFIKFILKLIRKFFGIIFGGFTI